jgi:hypothetical protein
MFLFGRELLASGGRQFVIARLAIVVRYSPFSFDPPLRFQTIERGVKRTLFDTQNIFRYLLDPVRYRQPMSCIVLERFEDQHVERSVNEVGFRFRHKGLVDLDSLGEKTVQSFP